MHNPNQAHLSAHLLSVICLSICQPVWHQLFAISSSSLEPLGQFNKILHEAFFSLRSSRLLFQMKIEVMYYFSRVDDGNSKNTMWIFFICFSDSRKHLTYSIKLWTNIFRWWGFKNYQRKGHCLACLKGNMFDRKQEKGEIKMK